MADSNGHDPDIRLILLELQAIRSGVGAISAQLAEMRIDLAGLRHEVSEMRIGLFLRSRIDGIARRLDGGA